MNGQQLINDLMYSVGKVQTLTADTNYRTMALAWLNQVKNDICSRKRHWTWLEKTSTFPTVADQLSYDLPSDYDKSGGKIFSLKQTTTPTKLKYIDQNTFDRYESDPTNTGGNPEYYTIWASSLRLWPTPDSVITMTLRYLKNQATDFADNSTTHTEIPTKWSKVFLDGLLVSGYKFSPEWGDWRSQTQIYEAGVSRMIDDDNEVADTNNVSSKRGIGLGMGGHLFNKDAVGD